MAKILVTSEMIIQGLWSEAGVRGTGDELVDARGIEAAAVWGSLRRYGNTDNFCVTRRYHAGQASHLCGSLAFTPERLGAVWRLNREGPSRHAEQSERSRRVSFSRPRSSSRHGPGDAGTSVGYGQPPGAAHGIDVDEQGAGTVTEQRLYQLIRQPKPTADRQFEIEFLGSGVEVFSFTFG
jgi:hypothetical protein